MRASQGKWREPLPSASCYLASPSCSRIGASTLPQRCSAVAPVSLLLSALTLSDPGKERAKGSSTVDSLYDWASLSRPAFFWSFLGLPSKGKTHFIWENTCNSQGSAGPVGWICGKLCLGLLKRPCASLLSKSSQGCGDGNKAPRNLNNFEICGLDRTHIQEVHWLYPGQPAQNASL